MERRLVEAQRRGGRRAARQQLSEADAAGEEVLTFDAIRQLGLLFVVSTPPLLLWHGSCHKEMAVAWTRARGRQATSRERGF